MAGQLVGKISICDSMFGGIYRVRGTVTEMGVAGHYRVLLYERSSGNIVRAIYSNAADGSYSFDYIKYIPNGYFVIAFDHSEPFHNAAIADLVTPEPTP